MSFDGKILRRAMDRLEADKQENEDMYARRREIVYKRSPRVLTIDKELRNSFAEAAVHAFSGTSGNSIEEEMRKIADKNIHLQEERTALIVAAGFPPDYIDDRPLCSECGDTGYSHGRMCSCLMSRCKAAQAEELSNLLNLREENFDSFRLEYYSDATYEGQRVSPRQNMSLIYEYSRQYAEKFSKASASLLFSGGTGLGKTFLSSCIARVVSERGFSVVYDTAANIFRKFEWERFSQNPEEKEAASDEVMRYLNCDLLILDDLGTEMITSFTKSAFYDLVNTRLCKKNPTIISTNLSTEELFKRYTPQIMSRLQGEYDLMPFYGNDIRLIKKGIEPVK